MPVRTLLRTAITVGALAVLAGALVIDWRLTFNGFPGPRGDLSVYVRALGDAAAGGSLYDLVMPNGLGFSYPPFAAIFLAPTTWIHEPLLGQVVTAWSMALCVGMAFLVVRASPVRPPWRLAATGVVAALLLLTPPVQSNLIEGQVSLTIAAGLLLDASGLVPERLRGVLTGILAAVKLTPLAFIPFLWIGRRRGDAARALAAFGTATLLAFLVRPGDSKRFWTAVLWDSGHVGDPSLTANKSLYGVLSRFDLSNGTRLALWGIGSVLVYAVALAAARRLLLAGDAIAAFVVVGAASTVISPFTWLHHQPWLGCAAGILLLRLRPLPMVLGALLALVLLKMSWLEIVLLGRHVPVDIVPLAFASALVICAFGLSGRGRSASGRSGFGRTPRRPDNFRQLSETRP